MVVFYCKRHPKYRALRKPSVPCDPCWYLWVTVTWRPGFMENFAVKRDV